MVIPFIHFQNTCIQNDSFFSDSTPHSSCITLTMPEVTNQREGEYVCRVTNTQQRKQEARVELQVYGK